MTRFPLPSPHVCRREHVRTGPALGRSGCRLPPPRRSCRGAFTLTELLIVIALIALLVALLLGALSKVQAKARASTTLATMQAFSNASEAFHQEHGFYPGVVPEEILAFDPQISGTENAILHLVGGYAREDDDPAAYTSYTGTEFVFARPGGGQYRIKVAVDRIGEGPVINGKPYAPYYTPGEREFGVADGQVGAGSALPDLLDAWGNPIMYLRRIRSIGALTRVGGGPGGGTPVQFDGNPLSPYLGSEALGRLGRNQVYGGSNLGGSILTNVLSPVASANLAKIVGHPALPGQARGAFMLMSAGPDGIYLSAQDGPGSSGEEIVDVADRIDSGDLPPSIVEEYDDVLVFGGS